MMLPPHDMGPESENQSFDVVVIGGGINGAASAAALSHAGLRVLVCDKADFASQASGNSSMFIWGGIKYLQQREWRLVTQLCHSRNRLLHRLGYAVKPIAFDLLLGQRASPPAWQVWLGAWLYWVFGRGETRPPGKLPFAWLKKHFSHIGPLRGYSAIRYFDAFLPQGDSRFVWQFLHRAKEQGAQLCNYTEVVAGEYLNEGWRLTLANHRDSNAPPRRVQCQLIINATGGWSDSVSQCLELTNPNQLLLSKGVHLILPKFLALDDVVAFLAEDARLFYVIPFGKYCCVGTTDTREDEPQVNVTERDRQFILQQINRFFVLPEPMKPKDIIAERVAVRPLVREAAQGDENQDWFNLSRKHLIHSEPDKGAFTIMGGKLSDCLTVAEDLTSQVCGFLKAKQQHYFLADEQWIAPHNLEAIYEHFRHQCRRFGLDALPCHTPQHSWVETLWQRYGPKAQDVLLYLKENQELETLFDLQLLVAEVAFMRDQEMVTCVEDVLRRRTQLALMFRAEDLVQHPDILRCETILFSEVVGALE